MKIIIGLLLSISFLLNAAELPAVDINQSSKIQNVEHSETTIKDIGWGVLVAAAIPVYIVGGIVYYVVLIPIGAVAYMVKSVQQ